MVLPVSDGTTPKYCELKHFKDSMFDQNVGQQVAIRTVGIMARISDTNECLIKRLAGLSEVMPVPAVT